MGSERPDKKKEKKEKKLREESGVKKEKKDKKEKKEKKAKLAAALDEHLKGDSPAAVVPAAEAGPMAVDEVATPKKKGEVVPPAAAVLVEFAVPLADEKNVKKVLKGVRKAAKNNSLKRGVKEVVKTLRKSPASTPTNHSFPGVVIIAADISPADVISHIPVLCEDHNVPYIFVPSRAELGAAAKTKRPTSVVMVMEKADVKRKKDEKKEDEEDDGEKWEETYQGVAKLVQKETERQSFWQRGREA